MKTLVVVDCQNDFFEGGSLAVPNSLKIIPYVNSLIADESFDDIIFTKDFHPVEHCSFASNNGVEPFTVVNGEMKWPDHCVSFTKGSEIHKDIVIPIEHTKDMSIVNKGVSKNEEEYSAYMAMLLYTDDIIERTDTFYVVGLASDFCVKETALSLQNNTTKTVIVDLKGCAGVNEESTKKAIHDMGIAGITLIK